MSVVKSLLPVIDSVLGVRDTIGARLKPVSLVTRTWTGKEPGDGVANEICLPVRPSPQIVNLAHSLRLNEGGAIKQGDILLKGISKNAFPDFDVIRAKSSSRNVELFYQVGDDLYQVISTVEKYLTWDVQIRILSDQTRYL